MPRTNHKSKTLPATRPPAIRRSSIRRSPIRRPALGKMATDPDKTNPSLIPGVGSKTLGSGKKEEKPTLGSGKKDGESSNVEKDKMDVQLEDKVSKLNDKVLAKYQLKNDQKGVLGECREEMISDLKILGITGKSEENIKLSHEILLKSEIKMNDISEVRGRAIQSIEKELPAGLDSKTVEWLVKPNKKTGRRKMPATVTQTALKDDLSFAKAIDEFKGNVGLAIRKLSVFCSYIIIYQY